MPIGVLNRAAMRAKLAPKLVLLNSEVVVRFGFYNNAETNNVVFPHACLSSAITSDDCHRKPVVHIVCSIQNKK